MPPKKLKDYDDPTMSDNTLLVRVDDLICMAMGPLESNKVNFKLLQCVLEILARQLRVLETQVEIRITDLKPKLKGKKKGSHSKSDSEEKDKGKSDKAAHKEREKTEKAAVKEKDNREKVAQKEGEKTEKTVVEKVAQKEGEKTEKTAAKEQETHKKQGKEKKRADKENAKQEKKKEIEIAAGSGTRVGSIEVVTHSQFALLEAAVKDLAEKSGPLPTPALPDNQQLRTDIAKGTASLTDTMEAMQVTARVKAAEQTIGRMAGLLTHLATAGALPEEVAGILGDLKIGVEEDAADAQAAKYSSIAPRKSVAIDLKSIKSSQTSRIDDDRKSITSTAAVSKLKHLTTVGGMTSITSKPSTLYAAALPKVTKYEMEEALESLKENLTSKINSLMNKAAASADTAVNTAKAAADKVDIALKLNMRITTLHSLVNDYSDQLNGFNAGLSTQLQSFQEQMGQIRSDLSGGLKLLEQADTNGETTAIKELSERFQDLVVELDKSVHAHRKLTDLQAPLSNEMRTVVECLEMLREEKADRDEVIDGLRDKADTSCLSGFLTELEFEQARSVLDGRLHICHDKFSKQERAWMDAMKDLTYVTQEKAEFIQLLRLRDDTQKQLTELRDKQDKLSVALGEPKAALLTRQLGLNASCGACLTPALMEPMDTSYGAPPTLPAMRPQPTGAPAEPCTTEWKPLEPPDKREHACLRWVGGSHTLLSEAVTREKAVPLQIHATPTKRYTGYGSDGRLYMLEEELQPCLECNMISDKISEEFQQEDGAGDAGIKRITTVPVE